MKRFTLSLTLCLLATISLWAQDFIVERAVNLSKLTSWSDNSQFQWQAIDHDVDDNSTAMQQLVNLFKDPAAKDTAGFYQKIYNVRDDQYIVLRMNGGNTDRSFYVRVTAKVDLGDTISTNTKVYATNNYIYIMPPLVPMDIEVKVWPQDAGEEMAKSYILKNSSYGSVSLRSVMLDASRILPGKYDLQLVRYDQETELSDTTMIDDLQKQKLYTFYTDTDKGQLVDAYLRLDGFKRIRLEPQYWAMDAVTHVGDNSVMVMTGQKMPFRHHRRMDAPNPSYLDSRLFSHHDTLWVNLYQGNIPTTDIEGLTINAVQSDFEGTPLDKGLLQWGKDELTGRLYILTAGEPCEIETYRKGYVPTLTYYPGSYEHETGIISKKTEVVNVFLEELKESLTDGALVTEARMECMGITNDRRGDAYIAERTCGEVLPMALAEPVYYDEYASHKDTMKIVDGKRYMRYALFHAALVSEQKDMGKQVYLLKDPSGTEENHIKKDKLEGETTAVYSKYFTYSYWRSTFDLTDYLDINQSGRPVIALGDDVVRRLPIFHNYYQDTQQLKKDAEKNAKDMIDTKEGGDKADEELKEPMGALGLSLNFPMTPYYVRTGFMLDLFEAKKISGEVAFGVGYKGDLLTGKTPPASETGINTTLLSTEAGKTSEADLTHFYDTNFDAMKNRYDNMYNTSVIANAYAEVGTKFSAPLTLKSEDWSQSFARIFFDEIVVRGEVSLSASMSFSATNVIDWMGKKVGLGNFTGKLKNIARKYQILDVLDRYVFGSPFSVAAGVKLYAQGGVTSFKNLNKEQSSAPWNSTLLGVNVMGKANVDASIDLKLNLKAASAQFDLMAGAGAGFYAGAGVRMDMTNPFAGAAWDWYARVGWHYRVHFLSWSKADKDGEGRMDPEKSLIKPKNYSNPYHPNFAYFLSDMPEPTEARQYQLLHEQARRANTLPGDFLTEDVNDQHPVSYLSGGDDVAFHQTYENVNGNTAATASTKGVFVLSNYEMGGCSGFHTASTTDKDVVVLEQANAKISEEDLQDSLHIDETVARASKSFGVYYIKRDQQGWYEPQAVYSSTESTSIRPRVAMASDGTAVAVWQEGEIKRGSYLAEKDTAQLGDLYMQGNLMLSRFDGNETWTEPVAIQPLTENRALTDYLPTYDGQNVFLIASKATEREATEMVVLTVDAQNKVTLVDSVKTTTLPALKRIGNQNVMAWKELCDSTKGTYSIRMRSYDMMGKATNAIDAAVPVGSKEVQNFRLVSDLSAASLSNVALLWLERTEKNDSVFDVLKASRLVANSDKSFTPGSAMTVVNLHRATAQMGSYDGYMTNEKLQACYVATNADGSTQLNRTVTYFKNAFKYAIAFDEKNNQAFTNKEDKVTLLVTIQNIGTSNINKAVLTIKDTDLQYPFDVDIPAGGAVQERITVPYTMGTGLSTSMEVSYDDVLGTQAQARARYEARKSRRLFNLQRGVRRADDYAAEDATFEQHTSTLRPYYPRLECFVASQQVDEDGNNTVTICVRNHARRRLNRKYCLAVGLKSNINDVKFYPSSDTSHPTAHIVFSSEQPSIEGKRYKDSYYMDDYGSYEASYVTITIPEVTKRTTLFAGATLYYIDANNQIASDPCTFGNKRQGNFGRLVLLPTSKPTGIERVYDNDDPDGRLHVTRQGTTLQVSGAQPYQTLFLYTATGVAMARQQAGADGKATFPAPYGSGVALLSDGSETVKFRY